MHYLYPLAVAHGHNPHVWPDRAKCVAAREFYSRNLHHMEGALVGMAESDHFKSFLARMLDVPPEDPRREQVIGEVVTDMLISNVRFLNMIAFEIEDNFDAWQKEWGKSVTVSLSAPDSAGGSAGNIS